MSIWWRLIMVGLAVAVLGLVVRRMDPATAAVIVGGAFLITAAVAVTLIAVRWLA